MRKIAANYLFPISGQPIRNGYVLLSDDGIIVETGQLSRETPNTEFYNGILSPGFVNVHCSSELQRSLPYALSDIYNSGTQVIADMDKGTFVELPDSSEQIIAGRTVEANIICPFCNSMTENISPPVEEMRECGATICIGTGNGIPARIPSMIDAIKLLQINSKSINELLLWSTLNGAKAIGKENNFGSFEAGKRPGVVLIEYIDWDNFSLTKESRSRRIA